MEQQRQVPYPADAKDPVSYFAAFVELVRILRRDCPWDRKQTHQSIAYMLIEEAYETIEAIEERNDSELSKELGDILLHVVMHAVIAEERGGFELRDIIKAEFSKLVERHPHVFADSEQLSAGDVKKNWERLKMKEGRRSVLEGLPRAMPALLRAQRIQEKAASVGFDWDKADEVWQKVDEEMGELREALADGRRDRIEDEFGDLLFALMNAGRHAGIVGEESLQGSNNKFVTRFQYMEGRAAGQGRTLNDMTLEEMDLLWTQAKHEERRSDGNADH